MPSKKSRAVQRLGKAIRAARERRGHSQESFARSIAVDRGYYGAIERGEFNISFDTLVTIVRGLETTVAELTKQAGL
jgi:transcriptional regulator with XRE-family HTH domain